VSRYQKCKTILDFTEARDSEWQWHQLRHMQVCTSVQTDNHPSTPPLSFLQAGCPSCHPTNSVKALKALKMPQTVRKCLRISWCPDSDRHVWNVCVAVNAVCDAGFVESIQVFLVGCRAGLGRWTATTWHYVLLYVNCFFSLHCDYS